MYSGNKNAFIILLSSLFINFNLGMGVGELRKQNANGI